MLPPTRKSAGRDALTGLYTPEAFEGILKTEVARGARYRRPFSLFVLELNLRVEKTWASHYELFPQLVPIMTSGMRRSDAAGRLKGTVLGLLLTETRGAGALRVAERIRSQVGATPFQVEESIISTVTLNLGLAYFPVHGVSAAELTSSAEKAMLLARSQGGDQVVVYPDALHPDYPEPVET